MGQLSGGVITGLRLPLSDIPNNIEYNKVTSELNVDLTNMKAVIE